MKTIIKKPILLAVSLASLSVHAVPFNLGTDHEAFAREQILAAGAYTNPSAAIPDALTETLKITTTKVARFGGFRVTIFKAKDTGEAFVVPGDRFGTHAWKLARGGQKESTDLTMEDIFEREEAEENLGQLKATNVVPLTLPGRPMIYAGGVGENADGELIAKGWGPAMTVFGMVDEL